MTAKIYYSLRPASFKLDGGAMYGIIPKPLWNKLSPADELNRIDLALRLLLIRQGDRNILIDAGIGSENGEKFDKRFAVRGSEHPIKDALSTINLTPSDITDFVITHLHFDHVGGMGVTNNEGEMKPLFENALVHLHKDHYEYALSPTIRDSGSFHKHNFKPLIEDYIKRDKINWLNGESGEVLAGLKFKTSHGHTPHMIHPYDDKFIYLADIIPTSHHISVPWVMGYDIAPGQTTKDKEVLLKFIGDVGLKVIFEHDPEYWGASIKINERGQYAFDERFECRDNLSLEI